MPQMAPILWLPIFIIMLLTFMVMVVLLYFKPTPSLSATSTLLKAPTTNLWLW